MFFSISSAVADPCLFSPEMFLARRDVYPAVFWLKMTVKTLKETEMMLIYNLCKIHNYTTWLN